MSRNWMMLTGLLILGPLGTSQAHPLDSPDIVYIDGLPCNAACRSYMNRFRPQTAPQTLPLATLTPRSSCAVRHTPVTRRQGFESPPRARIAGQSAAIPPTWVAEPRPDGRAEVD